MSWYSQGKLLEGHCSDINFIKDVLRFNSSVYPENYKSLEWLIKCLKESNIIFKFNYGFHFHGYVDRFYSKNFAKFIDLNKLKDPEDLIIESADFITFIDLFLEIFGFKEIIKDYVIIASLCLVESSGESGVAGLIEKSLYYSFEVLFDKPDINIYDNNNRFNLLLFYSKDKKSDHDFNKLLDNKITKFFYFVEEFLHNELIPYIIDKENFKKNYLDKEYLKNKEKNLEDYFVDYFLNKNKADPDVKRWIDFKKSVSRDMIYDLESPFGDGYWFDFFA
jgi:hypothetical protein